MRLIVCRSCNRHVRALARACPFCGTELGVSDPAARQPGRLGRLALFTFGVTVAACGSSVTVTVTETGGEGGEAPHEGGAAGAPEGSGGMPASDGGAGGEPDCGGVSPLYGLPPPPDQGCGGGS